VSPRAVWARTSETLKSWFNLTQWPQWKETCGKLSRVVCVCVYIHRHTHIYIYTYIYIYIFTYIYVHISIYICIYVGSCLCLCVSVHIWWPLYGCVGPLVASPRAVWSRTSETLTSWLTLTKRPRWKEIGGNLSRVFVEDKRPLCQMSSTRLEDNWHSGR